MKHSRWGFAVFAVSSGLLCGCPGQKIAPVPAWSQSRADLANTAQNWVGAIGKDLNQTSVQVNQGTGGSPVVAPDGSIYVPFLLTSNNPARSELVHLSASLAILNRVGLDGALSTPATDPDGNVYVMQLSSDGSGAHLLSFPGNLQSSRFDVLIPSAVYVSPPKIFPLSSGCLIFESYVESVSKILVVNEEGKKLTVDPFICGSYGSGFGLSGVLIPVTSYPSFGIRSMNGTYYLVAPAYYCGVVFYSFTIENNSTKVRLVPSPNGDTNDNKYFGDGAIALDGTTVVNDSDGNVTAYDLVTGTQKWQIQVSGDLLGSRSPAFFVPGTLYVYTVTGTTLYKINLSTGQIEGQVGVVGPNVASPSIGGSYLYVSTQAGLFTYDVNLQLLAFAPLAGGVSSPTMDTSGRVFVSTGDGKVFVFPPL